MLKRIFWLSVVVACGWLAWQWFRQRQSEFGDTTPHFAPARPYTPPAAEPAAAPIPPPAAAPDTPEAPAATGATHDIGELFAEEPPASAAEPATAEAPATTAPAEANGAQEVVGYCMRCRTKRPMKGAHEEISESGRRAARGTCPVCGTNMFVFLATNDNERGATK